MTTPEPPAVGDIPTDAVHHATTTTVLNAETKTLTVLNATIVPKPVKVVFESVIVILTLVRDEMMEDPFVELAKDCVQGCHVLNTVTEDSDVGDLSNKLIDDLRRIVHDIESVIRERVSCAP